MELPIVQKIKDPDNVKAPKKNIHPHLPNISGVGGGSLLLMISPVKTGKSTIISNLLLSDSMYGQDCFDNVHILSNTIMNDVTSRHLLKVYDVYDKYDDNIINNIVNNQIKFEKEEQPEIAIVLDDCLGSVKREATVNHLASRFRHYNIKLMIISSQKFTNSVSPVVRSNATDVIIGSPFPNKKELSNVASEYGDLFGGEENFLKIYQKATPNRYDFLYLDLQENPPLAYHNFEKVVAVGDTIQE